jgi:vacuolar-type H+-ATPase subunit H
MTQDSVKAILSAEQQAEELYIEAQRQAERIVADANAQASRIQADMLAETTKRRQEIVDAAREVADKERARIQGEAQEESTRLEIRARENFDEAVAHVIRQVAGRR